jgi:hypothetical protein
MPIARGGADHRILAQCRMTGQIAQVANPGQAEFRGSWVKDDCGFANLIRTCVTVVLSGAASPSAAHGG